MTGGCLCGAVRLEVTGAPIRGGICHCLDCRKHLGAVFKTFVIYPRVNVTVSGETRTYTGGASGQERHFCAACGSQLFALDGGPELELFVGCLDAPDASPRPIYELWATRREGWLPELGLESHAENRVSGKPSAPRQ